MNHHHPAAPPPAHTPLPDSLDSLVDLHAFAAGVSRTLTERGFTHSEFTGSFILGNAPAQFRYPEGFAVFVRGQSAHALVDYRGTDDAARRRDQLAAISDALTDAGYDCSPPDSNGELHVAIQEKEVGR